MPSEIEGTHAIGDTKLYTKTWLPDGPPIAKLIHIHGFNDHINRYYNFFPSLSSRGIAVYAFDQRGWGRSVTSPSTRGLTGPTALVLSDIVSFIRTLLPSPVPLFILGHSMGGGEILTLASEPQYADLASQIRGWLCESPYIKLSKDTEPNVVTVFVGRLASKVAPHMHMHQPIPPANLVRDPEVIKSIETDPLLHGSGTLEGLSGMLDRSAALSGGKRILNKGVKSLWVGHGTNDKGTSWEASKKWVEQQKEVEDKTFRSYEGAYHQLHADTKEVAELLAKEVGDWILARSGVEGKKESKL